jgi:hypothetical protein
LLVFNPWQILHKFYLKKFIWDEFKNLARKVVVVTGRPRLFKTNIGMQLYQSNQATDYHLKSGLRKVE